MATEYTPQEIAELNAQAAEEIKRLGYVSAETKIVSMSMAGMLQGSLIAGIQLLITLTTALPLNKASGVRYVISSIAVIG